MNLWLRRSVVMAGRTALCAGVVMGLLWVRALAEARYELSRASAMAAQGNLLGASQARARAVRWAAPLNLYSTRALHELLETAQTLVASGEAAAALTTYRAVRGSLRASAGVLQSHTAVLARVDEQIAALSVQGRALPLDAVLDATSRQDKIRAELRPVEGRSGADLLALVGFWAWVGAAFGLAELAHESRVDVPAAAKGSLYVLCLLGFVCFGVGLWTAT